jgi:hypothetical protein
VAVGEGEVRYEPSVAVESAAKVLLHARSVTDKPIVLDYGTFDFTEPL